MLKFLPAVLQGHGLLALTQLLTSRTDNGGRERQNSKSWFPIFCHQTTDWCCICCLLRFVCQTEEGTAGHTDITCRPWEGAFTLQRGLSSDGPVWQQRQEFIRGAQREQELLWELVSGYGGNGPNSVQVMMGSLRFCEITVALCSYLLYLNVLVFFSISILLLLLLYLIFSIYSFIIYYFTLLSTFKKMFFIVYRGRKQTYNGPSVVSDMVSHETLFISQSTNPLKRNQRHKTNNALFQLLWLTASDPFVPFENKSWNQVANDVVSVFLKAQLFPKTSRPL